MSGPDPKPVSSRKRPRTPADREASARFKRTVLALDRGCVAHSDPADCEPPFSCHHVVPQQELRKAGLHDLLWDPANGATLCYRAHRRSHNRVEPLRRSSIPARCLRFAAQHGFGDVIERLYPAD